MNQHKRHWYRTLAFGLALSLLVLVALVSGQGAAAGVEYKESVNGHVRQIIPDEIEAINENATGAYSVATGAPLALSDQLPRPAGHPGGDGPPIAGRQRRLLAAAPGRPI